MEANDQRSLTIAFRIRQCLRDECRFRFPVSAELGDIGHCPICDDTTRTVIGPFVRHGPEPGLSGEPRLALEVFLDNIRSIHNAGSILRTCDGAGIDRVHLCGITATPKQARVGKTALGADKTVSWSYHRNGVEAIQELKRMGYFVWSLESTKPCQSLFDLGADVVPEPLVLVVGNELSGVDPGILTLSDKTVSLPMSGSKSSLNVAVALGVAVYWLQYGIREHVERN